MRHPHDSDAGKGAVEQEGPSQDGNTSLRGQLGHRTRNAMIKANDSDFPEPGGNPEHTGEPESAETETDPEEVAETQDRKSVV